MATSLNLDPLEMWRQAVTKLESGMNTLGNQSLSSEEFTKALHQFSTVSMQMQQILEKVLGKYLRTVNLPSHKDIVELAETLRRIEDKLDQLVPTAAPAAPRPARTRRPSAAIAAAPAEPSLPAPSPTPAIAAAPRRRTAGAKRAHKEA